MGENRDTPDPAGAGFLSGLTGDAMSEFNDNTAIINSTKTVEPIWPFWGLLETVERRIIFPGSIYSGIVFCSPKPDIFGRFSQITRRSLLMLKRRDIDELRFAAISIQARIENWFESYIDRETEERVSQDGDEFQQPGRDDYSDWEVFQECLDLASFDKSEFADFSFAEPEEHEIFATFALMVICDAVHSDSRSKINHSWQEPTLSQIKAIGSATIIAVEAMAQAERAQLEQKIRSSIALKQPEILAKELSRRASEKAVNAANTRHASNNAAKKWVRSEWALYHGEYSGNKSEFSRIYASRVMNEFSNSKGDPLKVTDKTIREVWLSDTPDAGK
jgi:hypothetical protein